MKKQISSKVSPNYGHHSERPATYVTKAVVADMKGHMDRIIRDNTELRIRNSELLYEISALKIALESKELEKNNIVHIYEDLLTQMITVENSMVAPNPEMTEFSEAIDGNDYIDQQVSCSQKSSSIYDSESQYQIPSKYSGKESEANESINSSLTDIYKPSNPNNEAVMDFPTLNLMKLTTARGLKILLQSNKQKLDTNRTKQAKDKSKVRLGSKASKQSKRSSQSYEIGKLVQRNKRNQQKIDRLLNRVRTKKTEAIFESQCI